VGEILETGMALCAIVPRSLRVCSRFLRAIEKIRETSMFWEKFENDYGSYFKTQISTGFLRQFARFVCSHSIHFS